MIKPKHRIHEHYRPMLKKISEQIKQLYRNVDNDTNWEGDIVGSSNAGEWLGQLGVADGIIDNLVASQEGS